jgi:EmrB/QacA subfamily drug resistance transporter
MSEPIRYGTRQARGLLLATVLASAIVLLDSTVVNVALPVLQRELQCGLSALQWIVDAYLLTLSALLLLGGSLGDRLGRRRVFIWGLAWFGVASILCAAAPSAGFLIAARALQGVGGALLVPGSLAILRGAMSDDDAARAIGVWAGLSGVSTAIGPPLGGWLIGISSWRIIFLLNVPLIAVALWATRFVPEQRAPGGRLDAPGALAAALGLGGSLYALIEGPARGFGDPSVIAAIALGAASSAAFVVIEARSEQPMLPLHLFRSRAFAGANATTLGVYFGLGGAMFLLVLELQRVLGFSALKSGLATAPLTVLLLVLSPVAGRLAGAFGPRPLMAAGPLLAAAGLWMLSLLRPTSGYAADVLPGLIVLGVGLASTVAPLTAAVLGAVDRDHAGIASGVNNAVARVASLLAVAALPLAGGMVGSTSDVDSLASGYGPAMRAAAVICALGGVCAALTIPSKKSGRAMRSS